MNDTVQFDFKCPNCGADVYYARPNSEIKWACSAPSCAYDSEVFAALLSIQSFTYMTEKKVWRGNEGAIWLQCVMSGEWWLSRWNPHTSLFVTHTKLTGPIAT